jgi:serine/threonine protein kinase/tetratricopeptide (TPR) repeat protein
MPIARRLNEGCMSEADATIRLGAFDLDRLIGKGGMATVWRANHTPSGTPVAIKVLSESRSHREGVLRFEREVEAVAGLNHPGIVDVYDYGQVSAQAGEAAQTAGIDAIKTDRPFLAMQLAERGSLADALPLTRWPSLRSLLLHLLDALAFAHAREVVHRDIKPDNVLLFNRANDNSHRPKLTDFGIAHALGPEAASQSSLNASETAGTPQYMPPEQLRAKWRDFGPWTDLYALGAMTFELAAGRPPFTGDNFMVLATKHLEEPPPDLEPNFPIPDGLERWLHKLMAKRPTHRFESAADAAAHLEALPRLDIDHADAHDPSDSPTTDAADSHHEDLGVADTIESPVSDTRILSTDSLPAPDTTPNSSEPSGGDSSPPGTNPMVPSTLSQSDWSTPPDDDTTSPDTQRISTKRTPPAQIVPEDWRRPAVRSAPSLSGIGLGLFGDRTPPMIDREQTRDQLWRHLRRTQRETATGLALLEGTSGLGKSRIAAETARRARELGCARVLRCSHSSLGGPLSGIGRLLEYLFVTWELDGPETLERVRQRLADIYAGTPRAQDERFLDDEAALLVGWMRATSDQAGRLGSRRAGYEAIRRLFHQLTRDRPLIVVFDDLQWGSEALGLCEHLLGVGHTDRQKRASLPLLLVGTIDHDADPVVGIEQKLDELRDASDGVETHNVDRLAEDDHHLLVREVLDLNPGLTQDISTQSQGHPLFAIQLISDLVDRDQLTPTATGFALEGEHQDLPNSLEAVWQRRLSFILQDESTRAAIEQAVALGRTVETSEWRAACDRADFEPAFDAIAALRRRGLVTDDEQHITFVYHSFREAIARDAQQAGRWRAHHRRCAHILQSLYPDDTRGVSRRIASHFISADCPEDALKPLLNAVQEAYDFGDYQLAAELLERRKQLLADEEADGRLDRYRAQGDLWRARLAHRRGESEDAVSLLSAVLSTARQHDWTAITVEAMRMLIDLQLDSGEPDSAFETATRLRDVFDDDLEGVDETKLWTTLGRLYFERGNLQQARDVLGQARNIYVERGDSFHPATIDVYLAVTFISERRLDRAADILENALPIARRLGDRSTEAECMNCLGEIARHRGEFTDAREYYRQAGDLWELTGDRDAAVAQLNEGLTLLDAGAYTEAFETLSRARTKLETQGMRQLLPPAEIGRAAHLITHGDMESAGECLERGLRIADETQHLSRDFANLTERVATLCRQEGHLDWAERLDALAAGQRKTLEDG